MELAQANTGKNDVSSIWGQILGTAGSVLTAKFNQESAEKLAGAQAKAAAQQASTNWTTIIFIGAGAVVVVIVLALIFRSRS